MKKLSDTNTKLLIAAVLFASWLGLIVWGDADKNRFVDFIYTALAGLGLYHTQTAPAKPGKQDEGEEQ